MKLPLRWSAVLVPLMAVDVGMGVGVSAHRDGALAGGQMLAWVQPSSHMGNSVLQVVVWGNSIGRGVAEHLHDATALGVAEQLHAAMHERHCGVARATASAWLLLRSGNILSATTAVA